MTATIIPFPCRESLKAKCSVSKTTGRPVVLLEQVSARGRVIVAECETAADLDRAIQAWTNNGCVAALPNGAA